MRVPIGTLRREFGPIRWPKKEKAAGCPAALSFGVLRSSDAAVALLPLAAAGDPERQQDQLEVETEARPLQVDAIEPELAGAADVARRVHLRQAGQAGTHAVARVVAWNLIQPDQLAIAPGLALRR